MVTIRTSFLPLRLVAARKEPVQLTVDIINNHPETKAYSIEVELPRGLALDRAGPKASDRKQVGELPPSQEKRLYYSIFAKAGVDADEYPITVIVHEHRKGSRDVIQSFTKEISLMAQNR
ncbi:MAG: hypothetical protein Q8P05_03170 [Candidatus Diapherotrites archaeon]|nr:hypothetical protein [Candidatus Diapherotrites archaeon]